MLLKKNSDKIIKALVTEGFDKALGLMTDIAQDIINPPAGDKGTYYFWHSIVLFYSFYEKIWKNK